MAIDLGTNIGWCVDWDPGRIPADLMWSARPWAYFPGNGDVPANWTPVDSQGWPIVSSGTAFGAIFEGSPWPGVFKLSFNTRSGTSGANSVSSYSGNITVTNWAYNAGTNVTSCDITVPSYANQFIWLNWSNVGTGITDVHLMRPLKDGSGWHAIGTPLSDHIIDRLKWFSTIRPAQTCSGESGKVSGTDSVWSGRTKPWGPQTRSSDSTRRGGVAWENLIAMANQANKDLWLNIPFNATDDYITKLAQLIRYGSDGATPYTSTQASPVFAPLAANLNFYFEHGNEIWNSGMGYWEAENEAAAYTELGWPAGTPSNDYVPLDQLTGPDPYYLKSRGVTNLPTYGWRRTGALVVRNSLLFRAVFGDAAMMTRVRPILATQHGRYGTTDEPLYYIRDVWGASGPTTVGGYTSPHQTANYYVYALATAPYVPIDNSTLNVTSAATMIDGINADMNSTTAGYPVVAMTWNHNIAASLGL
jgi:hypothetical protein